MFDVDKDNKDVAINNGDKEATFSKSFLLFAWIDKYVKYVYILDKYINIYGIMFFLLDSKQMQWLTQSM